MMQHSNNLPTIDLHPIATEDRMILPMFCDLATLYMMHLHSGIDLDAVFISEVESPSTVALDEDVADIWWLNCMI